MGGGGGVLPNFIKRELRDATFSTFFFIECPTFQ